MKKVLQGDPRLIILIILIIILSGARITEIPATNRSMVKHPLGTHVESCVAELPCTDADALVLHSPGTILQANNATMSLMTGYDRV